MAASGDVTIDQDGSRLQPYLIALARWCVSCLWSTATAVLYRLLANPLPQITASSAKPRPAGKEHLHPEPRVSCEVLHAPAEPRADVIFVHGLYGSLGNTWRQGEWRSKYKIEPNKISLKRPNSIPNCDCEKRKAFTYNEKEITFTNIEEFYKYKKVTDDDEFITEKFFDDKMTGQCYESQAKFVRDLFNFEIKKIEDKVKDVRCQCVGECEVGCGCVCDACYSWCWPRDWLRADFPDARVISINYTSDPHLWRPLWIKETKRLQLEARATQMVSQLVALGVGTRPVVWVGHSKGGLFIKQIYCEAYEAYLKMNKLTNEEFPNEDQNCDEFDKDNEINHKTDDVTRNNDVIKNFNVNIQNDIDKENDRRNTEEYSPNIVNKESLDLEIDFLIENSNDSDCDIKERDHRGLSQSSNKEDDVSLSRVASLFTSSSGFMFYSVPHRGSPLADIKAPLTARSVELQEMGRDCSLVTRLHSRWLAACSGGLSAPLVRSLVETNRTLMSVLWLRIVSVDSADAGIGALCGVSVDHREICKPSSRRCTLYTELKALIHAALDECKP